MPIKLLKLVFVLTSLGAAGAALGNVLVYQLHARADKGIVGDKDVTYHVGTPRVETPLTHTETLVETRVEAMQQSTPTQSLNIVFVKSILLRYADQQEKLHVDVFCLNGKRVMLVVEKLSHPLSSQVVFAPWEGC